MCGRYSLTTSADQLTRLFGVSPLPHWQPRYNIAPGQQAPVRRSAADGIPGLALLTWGLIPFWAERDKPSFVNARLETAADKPAFRAAWKQRRCVVPASGFYEWAAAGRIKQPWFFHPADGALLLLAGLWESWAGPDGTPQVTFALLTRSADDSVRAVHHRMPVLLTSSGEANWLQGLAPAPVLAPEALASHPVSSRVNRVACDDPELIAPLEAPRQGSLF